MPLAPHSRLGSYEILRRIGAGGMAEAYLAERAHLGVRRLFVLKRLKPEARDPKHPDRVDLSFLDEARLVARLRHPHIVQVFELLTVRDETYIVMEYVDGCTVDGLRERLPGQRVPPYAAAVAGRQVCGVLEYLHTGRDELGRLLPIVHRDIAPDNIMLGRDGRARVGDFGMAKPQYKITEGLVRGKDDYMAPEQAMGETDPGCDIYALGVTLFEALTGELPYTRAEMLRVSAGGEAPPPPSVMRLAPGVPKRLSELVGWAIWLDRARRVPSAAVIGAGLDEVIRACGAPDLLDLAALVELALGPAEPEPGAQPVTEVHERVRELPAPPAARAARGSVPTDGLDVFDAPGAGDDSSPNVTAPAIAAPTFPTEGAAALRADDEPKAIAASALTGPRPAVAPEPAYANRSHVITRVDRAPRTLAATRGDSAPNLLDEEAQVARASRPPRTRRLPSALVGGLLLATLAAGTAGRWLAKRSLPSAHAPPPAALEPEALAPPAAATQVPATPASRPAPAATSSPEGSAAPPRAEVTQAAAATPAPVKAEPPQAAAATPAPVKAEAPQSAPATPAPARAATSTARTSSRARGPRHGTVSWRCPPWWAEVSEDGHTFDESGNGSAELSAGVHFLRFRHAEQPPIILQVDVAAGSSTCVTIHFDVPHPHPEVAREPCN